MDRKIRNQILAELEHEAWEHNIKGANLLKKIRDLEAAFRAEDAIEDKKKARDDAVTEEAIDGIK